MDLHTIRVRGRIRRLLAVLALGALVLTLAPAAGSTTGDRTVLDPDVRHFGRSYEELAGDWYNWQVQFPLASNPVTENGAVDCSRGQSGKIWFLAGNFGGAAGEPNPAVRSCAIPAGRALFLPIANTLYWAPDDGPDVDTVRRKANADANRISRLRVTLDGTAIPDPFAYRAQSPPGGFALRWGLLLKDFGYERRPDPRQPAAADGYWILLAPLARGAHTLRIESGDGAQFSLDVTYHLTVGGRGA